MDPEEEEKAVASDVDAGCAAEGAEEEELEVDEEVDEMTKLVKEFSAVANNMKPPANNTEMFLLPSFLSIAIIVVAQ